MLCCVAGSDKARLYGQLHWGISSAGRAVALQAIGHRFDPDILHQWVAGRRLPAKNDCCAHCLQATAI